MAQTCKSEMLTTQFLDNWKGMGSRWAEEEEDMARPPGPRAAMQAVVLLAKLTKLSRSITTWLEHLLAKVAR